MPTVWTLWCYLTLCVWSDKIKSHRARFFSLIKTMLGPRIGSLAIESLLGQQDLLVGLSRYFILNSIYKKWWNWGSLFSFRSNSIMQRILMLQGINMFIPLLSWADIPEWGTIIWRKFHNAVVNLLAVILHAVCILWLPDDCNSQWYLLQYHAYNWETHEKACKEKSRTLWKNR